MSSLPKQYKLRKEFIDHAPSSATDNTGERTIRKVRSSRLKTVREIRQLLKLKFSVEKEESPFNIFTFDNLSSIKEAQKIDKKRGRRSHHFCQDELNTEYECYIIPPKISNRKSIQTVAARTTSVPFTSFVSEGEVKRGSGRNLLRTKIQRRTRTPSFFSRRRKSVVESPTPSQRNTNTSKGFGFVSWKKGRTASVSQEERTEMSETKTSQPNIASLFEEFGVMACSTHENLQFIRSTYLFEDSLFVFCESLRNSVNLFELIDSRSSSERWNITERHVAYIMKAVVSAVLYLHKENRVIRSLSLKNIFVKNRSEIKIGHFSEAAELSQNRPLLNEAKGEASYMAPEMLSSRFGRSVDIWAIGVMTKELLTGKLHSKEQQNNDSVSFHSRSDLATLIQISNGCITVNDLSADRNISPCSREFCQVCFRKPLSSTVQDETSITEIYTGNMNSSSTVTVQDLSRKTSKSSRNSEMTRPTAFQLSKHPFLSLACSSRMFLAQFEEIQELSIF